MARGLVYDVDYNFEEVDDVRTWDYGNFDEEEADPREYWQSAGDVINAWSRYQAMKKLYINATHPETSFKVLDVVVRYHRGDVREIKRREEEFSAHLDIKLNSFKKVCDKFDVEPVSRQWLYEHLRDSADYASYRGKCDRRKAFLKPAESLKNL